ncbi:MAG: hypothetical protein AABM30_09315 [Actinomycetota bacterium]
MNLRDQAAQAAEAFDNRWTKDATSVELRALVESAKVAKTETADPVITRWVRARVETRRRLGLPAVDCTARRPGDCNCLTAALSEIEAFASPGLANVTKKELLARSSMLHKTARKKRSRPKRPDADALAQLPAGVAQSPPQPPQPSPEAPEPPPSPQPRVRPVHRSPKWYDDDEGSIIDRIF